MRALAALVLASSLPALGAAPPLTPAACRTGVYRGFDSRLAPVLLGRIPASAAEPVVGFEALQGKALVALPHRLLAVGAGRIFAVPVLPVTQGLSFDAGGRIGLQTAAGFLFMDPDGAAMIRTAVPGLSPGARLLDSGGDVAVEAMEASGAVELIALRRDGRRFPIARIAGPLRAASWNALGLAAIVGNSLFIWPAGAGRISRLASDRGFEKARDVCLVGPNRAVVALPHVVLLIGAPGASVIVGFGGRARWSEGRLYLLDDAEGAVWQVGGLESLAGWKSDQAHARRLICGGGPAQEAPRTRLLEAARILGCPATFTLARQCQPYRRASAPVLPRLSPARLALRSPGAAGGSVRAGHETTRCDAYRPGSVTGRAGRQSARPPRRGALEYSRPARRCRP